jgi:hypothetical protein
MRKMPKSIVGILVAILCSGIVVGAAAVYLKEFNFNDEKALKKWNRMILNGEVNYQLVRDGDDGYVQAVSEKACSALYYRLGYKLKDYPYLRWQWRVLQFPDTSEAVTEEDRDDYAARVYVIFPFLCFTASTFLEYIWAEDIPIGTVVDSPFGNNVKMVVARSGPVTEGEWVGETRNVYQDYIKAFGKKPRMRVGAVAIMCDADSTQTSAESLFDNIAIGSQEAL